jgi:hypothetical protein
MDNVYPRVDGAQLTQHLGRCVMFIGEVVEAQNGEIIKLRAPDGTEVVARLPMGEMVQGKYVQIVAKVDHNNTLEALRLTDMNSNFDMGVYSKALQMMASPLCAQLFT